VVERRHLHGQRQLLRAHAVGRRVVANNDRVVCGLWQQQAAAAAAAAATEHTHLAAPLFSIKTQHAAASKQKSFAVAGARAAAGALRRRKIKKPTPFGCPINLCAHPANASLTRRLHALWAV
jgi:hypothetical protein